MKGREKAWAEKAKLRQQEDINLCMAECTLVQTACPSEKKLLQLEHYDERLATAKLPKNANDGKWREVLSEVPPVSDQDYTKCEHAAERFVQMLFVLAHKPTKVRFDLVDPKTGKKLGSNDVEKMTKNLQSGDEVAIRADAMNQSVDKKAFTEMYNKKVANSLRSSHAQAQAPEAKDESAEAGSGTTPRW